MGTRMNLLASNADKSVNVHFETMVSHRTGVGADVIFEKALSKMRTHLRRYNPDVLAELVTYGIE